MSLLIDFVKTCPGLSLGIVVALFSLPWIIDIIIAVLRIRTMIGG